MTFEEEAIWLSKAVILLDKYEFIQTYEESEEGHCEQLRHIAIQHAKNIRELAHHNSPEGKMKRNKRNAEMQQQPIPDMGVPQI